MAKKPANRDQAGGERSIVLDAPVETDRESKGPVSEHALLDSGTARGVSRRQMLKIAAGAVVAAPLAAKVMDAAASAQAATPRLSGSVARAMSAGSTAPADGPLFFTKEQYAVLDELTEMIIPTDDHSPGARAAKVAEYIDRRLSEEFEDKVKQDWRDGLKAVEDLSRELNQKPFMECSPEQRHAVLAKMAMGMGDAKTPAQRFFEPLKSWTAFGYYTTKIGIHQEMEYKGNSVQLEFSGYDAT